MFLLLYSVLYHYCYHYCAGIVYISSIDLLHSRRLTWPVIRMKAIINNKYSIITNSILSKNSFFHPSKEVNNVSRSLFNRVIIYNYKIVMTCILIKNGVSTYLPATQFFLTCCVFFLSVFSRVFVCSATKKNGCRPKSHSMKLTPRVISPEIMELFSWNFGKANIFPFGTCHFNAHSYCT